MAVLKKKKNKKWHGLGRFNLNFFKTIS